MVFEIVFSESLSKAGAHILPNSAAMTLAAPLMGYLVKRTRRYKWLTVVCCSGPVLAMALLASLNPASGSAVRWLSVVPMGAGFSGLLTLTLIGMLNSVPGESCRGIGRARGAVVKMFGLERCLVDG